MDRRTLIGSGLAAALALDGGAAAATPPPAIESFDLWPGAAPGGERVTAKQAEIPRVAGAPPGDVSTIHPTRPTLTVFAAATPNGAAVLMIPGGGYSKVIVGARLAVAQWYAARGITAFMLLYRLPGDGWAAGPDTPLQDAQRAMRLIRSRAGRYGFDAGRVAAMGFSAGGHLAGMLAMRPDEPTYAPVDAADALPARPTVAALLYPVITMGEKAHAGSRNEMLGADPRPDRVRAYSLELNVPAAIPPTFLAAAADDATVPIENSLMMFAALRARGIPSELHVMESGGHGFGTINPKTGLAMAWPQLVLDWGRGHGWPA